MRSSASSRHFPFTNIAAPTLVFMAGPNQDSPSGLSTILDDCPLPVRDQMRNVVVVGLNTGLSYLAAPVMYVDAVHAVLCKELGATAFVYNLPSSAYLLFSAAPLFVAWLLPRAAHLKPVIVSCYAGMAVAGVLVAVALSLDIPNSAKIAVIILHGALTGVGRTLAVAGEFEVLGRAVAPSRRGRALALAYGLGPILAIVGNLVAQLLLTAKLGPIQITPRIFPANFQLLFVASAPVLMIATFLASRLLIPTTDDHASPRIGGLFDGLGEFLSRRVVLNSVAVAILLASGATMGSNLATYAEKVFGRSADQYAGVLKATLFSFKAVAGLFLGWLLTQTNPKTCVLASGFCMMSAGLWAIVTPAQAYFLCFGLLGMGQLSGVYITNYLIYCATPDKMRKYMAFAMLSQVPCALSGQFLGWIKDRFTGSSEVLGFQASFAAAAAFVVAGLLLALLLPPRPDAAEPGVE